MKKYLLILTCLMGLGRAKAQWVATVAGVLETPGFNDGPALSARFYNSHGIGVDAEGKVYVADRYNHTVRVFDPATGLVSTLAGKALQPGSTDGVGEAARFNEPWGLCVTPDGVVYVADTKNNKIRKVLPDGTVSTVAGTGNFGSSNGPAPAATFGNPTGIEIDADGNIYVADHLTHIIRKISNAGIVSTIAGIPYIPGNLDGTGSAAQFWRPYGLTLDNEGNLLVADEWNHKIRRVTPDGVVTTVAGNGQIALVDGPAQTASFNYPWDMTVDPAGNIYVADGYNYVIRKIDTNGSVSTLAGNPQTSGGTDGQGPQASFSGATAIAWSVSSASLFVGDAYNHLVREITLDNVPDPTLSIYNVSGTTQLCEGDLFNIQANPNIYEVYRFYHNGQLVQEDFASGFSTQQLEIGEHTFYAEADYQGQTLTSNTITVTVVPTPQPEISAVGPLTFYEGDSVILIATGTGEYLWSTGATTASITVMDPGTYFVELTNNGCTGISQEVIVEVIPLPGGVTVVVEGKTTLCKGESTRLVSSATQGNQWLKDGWTMEGETGQFLNVTLEGVYQVQVTDPATGITTLSNEVEIKVATTPNFDFLATPLSGNPGEEVSFEITGQDLPASFKWDFGDPASGDNNESETANPVHIYQQPGSYSIGLLVTDASGCEHEIIKNNYIKIGEVPVVVEGLFIPNAFTPNNDGENDIFRVRGYSGGPFYMAVFNQWGELLYESDDPLSGWDGTRNLLPVHNGTYVYLVKTQTPDGPRQLTGHITLLR